MIRYLFVSLFCLLFALPLTADELTSTLGNPLTEVSHDVVVKIIDGHAAYTVTRVFINRGERPDEAMLQLDLPFGAAADGMRIKAGNRWYDAELLHADVAREKYNELTGLGRHKLKDPALLEWGWNDQLQLEVFPIITGKTSTVQYTLVAPTEYRDGRYTITYPRHNGDPDLAVPTITVRSDETVTLDGHPVSAGRPLVLAEDLRSSRCEELGYAAHCAVVSIPVADEGRFSELKLQVSLSHSYLSDLRGFLIAPDETTHALEVASDAWGKPIAIKFPEATVSGVWHLVIVDEVPLDRGTIRAVTLNGKNAIGSGEALPALIPDVPEEDTGTFALITVGKPHPNKTAVRYGRVVVPSQKKDSIARVELDVAAKLSQLPKRPRYIFVVDASHSAGETGVQSQIDIIAAMLHHVPDAEFEIVAYARKARRVLGSFKPVSALETLPQYNSRRRSRARKRPDRRSRSS